MRRWSWWIDPQRPWYVERPFPWMLVAITAAITLGILAAAVLLTVAFRP